jgi:hypothetical protein
MPVTVEFSDRQWRCLFMAVGFQFRRMEKTVEMRRPQLCRADDLTIVFGLYSAHQKAWRVRFIIAANSKSSVHYGFARLILSAISRSA